MWCVAELDDEYITRMEDTLQTYERPYDPLQPVACLDEKPVTLHADVRPPSPAKPGREARFDSEYERRGTANVFCAVEPKAGRHFTFVTSNRSGDQFAQVLFHLALAYPKVETIHLAMDNLSTHTSKSLRAFYGEQIGTEIWDRFTVHYTPKHGSWLNQVNQAEIEIGLFLRQCLGKRRIPDLKTLDQQVRAWNRRTTGPRSRSTGSLTARRSASASATKAKTSSGRRTSSPGEPIPDGQTRFSNEKELAKIAANWPAERLVEIWNGFAGLPPFGDLKPVKKFTDRKTAVARIWKAVQALTPAARATRGPCRNEAGQGSQGGHRPRRGEARARRLEGGHRS
jgi:transposase